MGKKEARTPLSSQAFTFDWAISERIIAVIAVSLARERSLERRGKSLNSIAARGDGMDQTARFTIWKGCAPIYEKTKGEMGSITKWNALKRYRWVSAEKWEMAEKFQQAIDQTASAMEHWRGVAINEQD